MIMEPFDAYKKFQALKLHFTSDSYDYFKYNGSVKVNKISFETKNDKYYYYRLSKKPDLELFLASNFIEDDNVWVGNIFDEIHETRYKNAKRKHESLSYMVKSELSNYESLNDALVVTNGNYPKILNDYNRGSVSAETLVVLDRTLNVFDYWSNNISDTVVWPRKKMKLLKYAPFLQFDKKKMNALLVDIFRESV